MGRTEEGYKTERLIIEVEKNTCLYDKQSPLYKDLNKKEDIWNDIAQRVGFTVPDAKQRWKAVRDNYRKYRNTLKSKNGQAAKAVAPYKFSGILGFLNPFLEDRVSTSNLGEDDLQHAEMDEDVNEDGSTAEPKEEDDAEEFTNDDNVPISQSPPAHSSVSSRPTIPTLLRPSGNRKRKAAENDTVDAAIADFLTEKKKVLMNKRTAAVEEKEDDIGHFMKSMAATIRKLPTHARADIKYRIHGIVHEAEMIYL